MDNPLCNYFYLTTLSHLSSKAVTSHPSIVSQNTEMVVTKNMEMNVIQNMFPETFKAAGFSRHSLGSDGLHFSTFN